MHRLRICTKGLDDGHIIPVHCEDTRCVSEHVMRSVRRCQGYIIWWSAAKVWLMCIASGLCTNRWRVSGQAGRTFWMCQGCVSKESTTKFYKMEVSFSWSTHTNDACWCRQRMLCDCRWCHMRIKTQMKTVSANHMTVWTKQSCACCAESQQKNSIW